MIRLTALWIGGMILDMKFKREVATSELLAEMMPLFRLHYSEIAHFKDIELDPDIDRYLEMEKADCIRLFTARELGGKLLGYSVYVLFHAPHYRQSKQASQDVLFIYPESRGFGRSFIKWCDEQLTLDGVQVVSHHVKVAHNFGPMLEKMGYEMVEYIYVKRLDLGA